MSSSDSSTPGWAVCTATLCPCLAAIMMFFSMYGGLVVCLLAAVAIVLGSGSRMAAVPAIIIACYGFYEGVWILIRLWPWNIPYHNWEWSETLAAEYMACGLVLMSLLLFVSAVVACIKAPVYRKRQAKTLKLASQAQAATAPPVIVTEYTPDRKSSPRIPSGPHPCTVLQMGYDGQIYSEPGTYYPEGGNVVTEMIPHPQAVPVIYADQVRNQSQVGISPQRFQSPHQIQHQQIHPQLLNQIQPQLEVQPQRIQVTVTPVSHHKPITNVEQSYVNIGGKHGEGSVHGGVPNYTNVAHPV